MSRNLVKIFLCSVILAAATASPSAAQQSALATKTAAPQVAEGQCTQAPIHVSAETTDQHAVVCSAIDDAMKRLRRCEIALRRPLRVQITRDLRHPLNHSVLGFFDAPRETVFIAHEEKISALVRGTPFAKVPMRDLFRSIVIHEVTHGLMYQNAMKNVMSASAEEYVAYALQIGSFTPSVRDQFMQSISNKTSTDAFVFNDIMLVLDPFFFAAHAYMHFEASTDSCARLAALIGGEVAFISTPPY